VTIIRSPDIPITFRNGLETGGALNTLFNGTMTRIPILPIILGVCCVLAEDEFTTTTELSKSRPSSEDRLLTNDVLANSSSQLILDESNDEKPKTTDKKPRTAIRSESSSRTRDK